jgi:L,D-transpeptidase ErfK/SrfK
MAQPASARLVGDVHEVIVAPGDTLRSIAAANGVDPATIAADNGMMVTARLSSGQSLRIDNRHIVPAALAPGTVVVNIPQRMVFVGSEATLAVPVAVGRRTWPTPLGAFTIVAKEENPTWDVPASIQAEARRAGKSLPKSVPLGPDNPLGRYWLALNVGSIGIHGTNAPSSIYQAVTHGCIRVHPDAIGAVFEAVRVGTAGALVYEPILAGRDGSRIYLEVHPDVYRRSTLAPMSEAKALLAQIAAPEDVDWASVAAVVAAHAGVARLVSFPSP